MRFVKMHGLGNDYVYVNGFDAGNADALKDPADLAQRVADRNFGIGGDGLILLLPAEDGVEADLRMRMFNADGSEAEMCGNGIRCVCKFAFDHGITEAQPMRVQTGAGVLSLRYETNGDGAVAQVSVDMGEPILEPLEVPVDPSAMTATEQPQTFSLSTMDGNSFFATMVSMGNPHAVIFTEQLLSDEHLRFGPLLEKHAAFPNRMNIHFVQVHGPGEVTVKHWERGSGPTLACGTGACAVCVAGVLTGRTQREVIAHLPGGDLKLAWDEATNHVIMTGPATEVFSGEWPD